MANRVVEFHFQRCVVYCYPDDVYCETVFHDGQIVPATPQDTDEYRARAQSLGYGADTARMSREHELCHTLLAEALGQPFSPTLWAVAHHDELTNETAAAVFASEEALVLAFQAYLNDQGEAAGSSLPESVRVIKVDALRLLRGNPFGESSNQP